MDPIFTNSDAVLNFCYIDFCLKLTLYFLSTRNIMKEFSRSFDFRKLVNISVNVFMKAWPLKGSHIASWRGRILQHCTKPQLQLFYESSYIYFCSWYIYKSSKFFSSENDWTSLTFTRPRLVLTRKHNFKMAINLLESKLYLWKFIFLHSFGRGIRIYFHLATKINR